MARIIEIGSLEYPGLDVYTSLGERELLTLYEPGEGIFIAESPKVISRALDAGYTPVSILAQKDLLRGETARLADRVGDIPIYTASAEALRHITGFPLTRGVLCAMRRKKLPRLQDILHLEGDAAGKSVFRRICVLENVMNPTNVGAVFRSAAAMGLEAVVLTKGSADPLYRRAIRVSMGTVFQIPWTIVSHTDWHSELRDLGFRSCAMALSDDTICVDAPVLKDIRNVAIVLGTEGDGLAKETISDCDFRVKIPMAEGVDSLNVAAASAVAFWELSKPRVSYR